MIPEPAVREIPVAPYVGSPCPYADYQTLNLDTFLDLAAMMPMTFTPLMEKTMSQTLRELLDTIPEPVDRGDDFNPADWSGHNFDDTYQMGLDDGYNMLASHIRAILDEETLESPDLDREPR